MWTKAFWKAAAERAIRAGAAAGLSSFVVGDKILSIAAVDLAAFGGIFLGGAVVSVLLGLAGNVATQSGPSFGQTETVKPSA